ncbi:MAG TPA: hypothetical protein VHL55_04175 [Acidimicrobiia bacterium]|nr:hypothetical protein [Acidimicrobiia bacterium]
MSAPDPRIAPGDRVTSSMAGFVLASMPPRTDLCTAFFGVEAVIPLP